MVSLGSVLLASAVATAGIPRAQNQARFPDPSYWPGVGIRQVANMLDEIGRESGTAMRSLGLGPQQLAARWATGRLDREDRIAVLLGGAAFHDPVLLPLYADAVRSGDLRERRAAAVGFSWLLGDPPPDPTALTDTRRVWENMEGITDALVAATRTRTLVGIWVDSYLAGIGVPHRPGLTLRRKPEQCLAAIREIAEPGDLNELLALWPLLPTESDRYHVLRTLEIITMSRLVAVQKGDRAWWGDWIYDTGAFMIDALVKRTCESVDGEGVLRANLAKLTGGDGCDGCTVRPWVRVLRYAYAPVWAVALERLPAFGAPAVPFDRRDADATINEDALAVMRGYFPVTLRRSYEEVPTAPRSRPTPRPWEVPFPLRTPTTDERR